MYKSLSIYCTNATNNVHAEQLSMLNNDNTINPAMLPTNNAKTLPATGDDNSHSWLAGIALAIGSFLGMLGLAKTKKQRD